MKDLVGNKLQIGDFVFFVYKDASLKKAKLTKGVVKDFLPKTIKINVVEYGDYTTNMLKKPEWILKYDWRIKKENISKEVIEQWELLEDIPCNEEEEIEMNFLHFEIGAGKYEIWNWFEEKYNISVAEDLMYIN